MSSVLTELTENENWRRNLFETGFQSDVEIIVRDGVISGHEMFLTASHVLKAELEQPAKTSTPVAGCSYQAFQESIKKTLSMEKRTMEEVKEFLSFLYLGETPKALENVSLAMTLHGMGMEYDLPALVSMMCQILMNMSMDIANFFRNEASRIIAIISSESRIEELAKEANEAQKLPVAVPDRAGDGEEDKKWTSKAGVGDGADKGAKKQRNEKTEEEAKMKLKTIMGNEKDKADVDPNRQCASTDEIVGDAAILDERDIIELEQLLESESADSSTTFNSTREYSDEFEDCDLIELEQLVESEVELVASGADNNEESSNEIPIDNAFGLQYWSPSISKLE